MPDINSAGDARGAQRDDAVLLAVDDVGDGLPHFFPVELRDLEVEVDRRAAVGRRADHPDAAAAKLQLGRGRKAVGGVVDLFGQDQRRHRRASRRCRRRCGQRHLVGDPRAVPLFQGVLGLGDQVGIEAVRAGNDELARAELLKLDPAGCSKRPSRCLTPCATSSLTRRAKSP